MKDSEYDKLSEWVNEGTGALIPHNSLAYDLTDVAKTGEIITMREMTDRDLRFHRCYMSLISFIYDELPLRFQKRLQKKYFYKYLKHLKGQFDIVAQVGNVVLVEYESISFGRMSEFAFKDYVRTQLPWIYTDVIGKYYKAGGWRYNRKINLIETEYEKFLSKL
ncbi:MAG: hypothetical protein WC886_07195 [Saccharofermentanaceae bacterium]|jgi:hypothetical protein